MKILRVIAAAAAFSLMGAGSTAPARAAEVPADVELVDYVVQPGDSCAKIAKALFGDAKRIDVIHRYNPLGPLPHDLEPGQVLKVPVPAREAQPDARLTRAHGAVRVRPPETPAWSPGARGAQLFRAWRVNSQAQAQADVTFRDTNVLTVRENTVVVIFGPTRGAARTQVDEARLEEGAVSLRLGSLAGPGLRVDTPAAQVLFAGGRSVLDAGGQSGQTLVANHGGGAPIEVRGRNAAGEVRKAIVAVPSLYGSTVAAGQDPSPPRPLPAMPAWTAGPAGALGVPGRPGRLVASWRAVAGAARYRVVLSRDAAGEEPLQVVNVPATVTSFAAENLADGRYGLSVAALDADGLEGPATPVRPLVVASLARERAAGVAPRGADVALGERLTPPRGVRCGLGAAERTAPLVIDRPGKLVVSCVDDAGGELPGVALTVAPARVRMTLVDGPRLRRGERQTLAVEAPEALAGRLAVRVAGATGTLAGTPGALRLVLDVPADAPARLRVELTIIVDGQPIVVAARELDVAPR